MAQRIKSVSKYDNGNRDTAVPIGADAENVDVKTNTNTTSDLQTVLGVDSSTTPAATSLQVQINDKVSAENGDVGKTLIATDAQNPVIVYDLDTSETSTTLISDDLSQDTDMVVQSGSETLATMWSKFNRFRKRVDNKFKTFLTQNISASGGSNEKAYSTTAINTYLNNVIGYTSYNTPTAGTVSAQLSSIRTEANRFTNNFTWEVTRNGQPLTIILFNNGLNGISTVSNKKIGNDSTDPTWLTYSPAGETTTNDIYSVTHNSGVISHKLTGRRLMTVLRVHLLINNITTTAQTGSHWFTVVVRARPISGSSSDYATEYNLGTFVTTVGGGNLSIDTVRIINMKPSYYYGVCIYRSSTYTTDGYLSSGSVDITGLSHYAAS